MADQAALTDLSARLAAEASELAALAASEGAVAPPPAPPADPPPPAPPVPPAPDPVPVVTPPPDVPPPPIPQIPPGGTLTGPIMNALKQSIVGFFTDGWDPVAKGVKVNWYRDAAGAVKSQNTGHDTGVDLRTYEALVTARHMIGGQGVDSALDGFVARSRPLILAHFGANGYDKSWAPASYINLAALDDPVWMTGYHSLAKFWMGEIDPKIGVAHGPQVSSTGANPTKYPDAYRVDAQLQISAFLVDAGNRFGDQSMIDAGTRGLATCRAQGFVEKTGLYARMVAISNGVASIVDWQHKAGEQGQNAWALAIASGTGGAALAQQAAELLNGLNHGPLHDTVNGAFWFKQLGDTGDVDKSYKEFARTATIARAAKILGNEPLRAEMVACALKLFWQTPEAGWPYRCTGDFHQYGAENWVTGEAGGIIDLALLTAGS